MDLSGKLLIAMPSMGDVRFDRAVVLLCSHASDGAMGLIVNKPAQDVRLKDLLKQLDIPGTSRRGDMPVRFGGPVESERGFVLHSPEYPANSGHTLDVGGHFRMSATLDVLEDLAADRGPEKALMMLGYAGWGPGQLESEIGMNGWLTAEADETLVFGTEDSGKWEAALKSIGVDPLTLSMDAGHA